MDPQLKDAFEEYVHLKIVIHGTLKMLLDFTRQTGSSQILIPKRQCCLDFTSVRGQKKVQKSCPLVQGRFSGYNVCTCFAAQKGTLRIAILILGLSRGLQIQKDKCTYENTTTNTKNVQRQRGTFVDQNLDLEALSHVANFHHER